MKKTKTFVAAIILFALPVSIARADKLDDMITTLRSGGTLDPSKLGMNLLHEVYDAPGSSHKAFPEAAANLYIDEIKLSIADPESEGGWPCMSSLVVDENMRNAVADVLRTRFGIKPDSIVAYALICPALYADDVSKIALYETYLKDNDLFLYKIEQGNAPNWRNVVAKELSTRKADEAPQKKNGEKP